MSNEVITINDDIDILKTQLLEQKAAIEEMSREIRAILERLSSLFPPENVANG
jgi:hypothetical protein